MDVAVKEKVEVNYYYQRCEWPLIAKELEGLLKERGRFRIGCGYAVKVHPPYGYEHCGGWCSVGVGAVAAVEVAAAIAAQTGWINNRTKSDNDLKWVARFKELTGCPDIMIRGSNEEGIVQGNRRVAQNYPPVSFYVPAARTNRSNPRKEPPWQTRPPSIRPCSKASSPPNATRSARGSECGSTKPLRPPAPEPHADAQHADLRERDARDHGD